MSIEQKVNYKLQNYPILKRRIKRLYQRSAYLFSKKEASVGSVVRVSPDDAFEYSCGYYDKSPWDASDSVVLCLRAGCMSNEVAPAESAEVCLIDTRNGGAVSIIGTTHSWNVQQGCMAQWLGPDFRKRIAYNDFRDGQYCSVVYNVEKEREERVLPHPIYDVSHDGSFAMTLDFSRLHRLRPGYGYSCLPDPTEGKCLPDGPCISRMDMLSGNITTILDYSQLQEIDYRAEMDGADHKVNHIMISPDDKRFMVIHRWMRNGRKRSRLLTVGCDGSEIYVLCDDEFVSHCFWKDDKTIIAFINKAETGRHYYLLEDLSQKKQLLWPEIDFDGHPSYNPQRTTIVTDSYPDKRRMQHVLVGDENIIRTCASVFSPFKYDGDLRCDLHPRWSRDGTAICIDGTHDGKRAIYSIEVPSQKNDQMSEISDNENLVSVIIPTYKRKKYVDRAVRSALSQTYGNLEIFLVDDNEPGTEYSKYILQLVQNLNDSRLQLIRPPVHTNGAAARNVGIHRANGEYIAFLDDDDFWLPQKIEKQVDALRDLDSSWGGVSCGRIYIQDGHISRVSSNYADGLIYKEILERRMEVFTGTLLLRKSVFDEIGCFDESLTRHQDLQLLTSLTSQFKLKLVPGHYLCIDGSDPSNRPDAETLIRIKEDFFKAIEPVTALLTDGERRCIRGIHYSEIAFAFAKEGKFGKALRAGAKILPSPKAAFLVVARYGKRKYERGHIDELLNKERQAELFECLLDKSVGTQ